MQDFPIEAHGIHGDGAAGLASRLRAIAHDATQAATYAEGEYIPQFTREDELRRSLLGAGTVAARLEQAKRRIERLGTGENLLAIANAAIEELEAGRSSIQDGVQVTQDLLQNGIVVIDAVATGTAAAHFRQAATIIAGIADTALLESVPLDQLFAMITGSRPA